MVPIILEARFQQAMNGAYPALHRLRDEGAIKAIGIGANDADICARFARAGGFDTMLLAGRYSLLEQPANEGFLPLAKQKGIGVLLGGVFNSGILATGPVPGARYNLGIVGKGGARVLAAKIVAVLRQTPHLWPLLEPLLTAHAAIAAQAAKYDAQVKALIRSDQTARRLMTVPGVGPPDAVEAGYDTLHIWQDLMRSAFW